MIVDRLHFTFCLYIFSGLCLPSSTVKLKWPKLYYFYMIISDISAFISLMTIGANLIAPDIPLAKRCYSGFTVLATAQAITKLIACYIYKKQFSDYLKLWDDLIETNADSDLKEALLKNSQAFNRISICLFVFMVSPMIPWGSLPLFMKCLSYFIPALEGTYLFVAVPAQYPFNPLVSPVFEFITFFQGVAALSVNAKLMAYDCLIYGLISSQIVVYKYLNKRFKSILNLTEMEQETDIDETVMGKFYMNKCDDLKNIQKIQLIEWIEKHCNLIKLCQSLNQLYSPILLLQFFFSILILCSNAFVVATATVTKLELMFSLGYVIGVSIQLYVLCWLGEEITHQSMLLTDDGFWQPWYACPVEVHSSLKIIFERSKVLTKISAFGTFHLSIETFKSIVGTAYSYFMVLNTIKKEE